MESITIKDVARLSGVGVSTVSRAINNHPDINNETREKILKIIEEYNYIPNNSARNLKSSNTKTIALLIKGISNSFFSNMIVVFEEEIQKRKYNFVLHKVEQWENEIDVAVELIKEKRLNGIVFLGGIFTHTKNELNRIDVPFVLCTVAVHNDNKELFSSVSVDDIEESNKMVDYICSKGHKKIAIIASFKDDESIGKLRFEGYKNSLNKNGIDFEEKFVFYMKEDIEGYSLANGYQVMKEILESDVSKEITAIYAISDNLALGAARAIADKGFSIPKDYSIAGFDGLEIGNYYNPVLTTIKQPVESMAKASIKLLFDIIKNNTKQENIFFEAELVEGDSVCKI